MQKIMSFFLTISFFCLSSVSYADKYGDFIAPLDKAIRIGEKISYSDANLKRYMLAYNETIEVLKETAETTSASSFANCFGSDDVVDCTPIYCSRLESLCNGNNITLKEAIGEKNIKRLDEALKECGLEKEKFNNYLSNEYF